MPHQSLVVFQSFVSILLAAGELGRYLSLTDSVVVSTMMPDKIVAKSGEQPEPEIWLG